MISRDEIIEHLRKFKLENKDSYHIESLGLFGSVARNVASKHSDVDVVVVLKEQDLFDLIGIKQNLEESLKLPVDVISYRETMNPFLKKRIDQEAIYV